MTCSKAGICGKAIPLAEYCALFAHITTFLKALSSFRCWKQVLLLQDLLCLKSISHVAELRIAIRCLNADCRRAFELNFYELKKL